MIDPRARFMRSAPRRSRREQSGFTLIELTVALLAGLIVALGIVGLSKDSTRTFHEEIRSSAAEANLRVAVDRLRADLARAGYMSTSNIYNDPMIAKKPGTLNPGGTMVGLSRLSSIQLRQGGSVVNNGLSLSVVNGVNPDWIEIGGNMTSTEQFEVQLINPAGGSGGCQQILLSPSSPAMYRIIGASLQPSKELNNIFSPTTATMQFMVRLVDDTGHAQYLVTCPAGAAGVTGTAPNWQPYVNIDPGTPILTASQTQTIGGISGYASGRAWINPVQIVHWEITKASSEPTQYVTSPMGDLPLNPSAQDPNKYDLVRTYVDAATGKVVPQTAEVIAEYAVDFDVAFSVDTGTNLQPKISTLPYDSALNAPWAQDVSIPSVSGPQRIRSVRARLVTRTAQADRTLNIPVPNPTPPFMYRYCLLPTCNAINAAGILQYARTRTITAEVSVPNQSRDFFP
jgi:prepilin-type N-terminal cleavage/methylation domain-containing protein